MVRALIVTGFGINADCELKEAFFQAGAEVTMTHAQELLDRRERIDHFQILAFPGGFSFGDHLGSGRLLAHLFKRHLRPEIERFLASGRLLIGVCNGFQVLVKMGVLPNRRGDWEPEVSLIHNDSGVFEDSWVRLGFDQKSPCVWTQGLPEMELPIRHGEGRFVARSDKEFAALEREGLVAIRYVGRNPNGSQGAAAGLTDPTGQILGLMPHPEAFVRPEQHPRWTREKIVAGAGLALFKNGVDALR